MKQVKISSKNQITLPTSLLQARKISAGQRLYIVEDGANITLSTKNPLEQYTEKALLLRKKGLGQKAPHDPLKYRQELRQEWKEREDRLSR